MKFYEFMQNNSHGRTDEDENLAAFVFIEAESADTANEKLIALGGYFDGVASGPDCECCGDRWVRASEYDVVNNLADRQRDIARYWANSDIRIHYHKAE